MYYGFKSFGEDYLGRYPTYYINQHNTNGSITETIFGQMRHIALTAANYSSTHASLLTKWSIETANGSLNQLEFI